MSSSVKIINENRHETDSFSLSGGTSNTSSIYEINNYKSTTILVETSINVNAQFQVQWSNDQSTWFYEFSTTLNSITSPDSSSTKYQGKFSSSNNNGKYLRIEYYNPNASASNFSTSLNFFN